MGGLYRAVSVPPCGRPRSFSRESPRQYRQPSRCGSNRQLHPGSPPSLRPRLRSFPPRAKAGPAKHLQPSPRPMQQAMPRWQTASATVLETGRAREHLPEETAGLAAAGLPVSAPGRWRAGASGRRRSYRQGTAAGRRLRARRGRSIPPMRAARESRERWPCGFTWMRQAKRPTSASSVVPGMGASMRRRSVRCGSGPTGRG